jgi:plasmid stabilization system protein ParE
MVKDQYEVVWSKRSMQNMHAAYKYISKDSQTNAKKVLKDILKTKEKAIHNPEIYPIDKYKENNDGTYSAFEKHKYRVSYRIKKRVILVLRVRHTKMKVKKY